MVNFLVTTRAEVVNQIQDQVVMLDGTVPGWRKKPGDLHYDHHRLGGEHIQIAEIPKNISVSPAATIVTTMVDADACVAAAYSLLLSQGRQLTDSNRRRLQAIAWDCDHLYVPQNSLLSPYEKMAAQCVAALKTRSEAIARELGYPADRREWSIEQKEAWASISFRRGTIALMDAVIGVDPFPGSNGEAAQYWEEVAADTEQLRRENRVKPVGDLGCLIDLRGINRYVDPRCALKVIQEIPILPKHPVTLTIKDVWQEGILLGHSYTLAVVPWHCRTPAVDYTERIYDVLTTAELMAGRSMVYQWGGRATVGGSGWDTVSFLNPEEVLNVVTDNINPYCPSCRVGKVRTNGTSRGGKPRWICECGRNFTKK